MIHRFYGATKLAQIMAAQPAAWSTAAKKARGVATTVATTAQHTLTLVGLSALAVAAVVYARPDVAKQVSHFLAPHPAVVVQAAVLVQPSGPDLSGLVAAPAPAPAPAPVSAAPESAAAQSVVDNTPLTVDDKAMAGNQKQQQYVTSWLSKKYRVAGDATNMLVSTAYLTAHEIKLDPLLILAVMAIESGLNPFAESPVGAQGLMQVMSKIHHAKFQKMGGMQAALNPVANIRVGAQILKEYVKRGGSVEAGLKTYVGAAAFDTDQGYGSKVMAEYARLKLVAKGKAVPTFNKPAAPAAIVADKTAPRLEQVPTTPTVEVGEQLAALN